MSGSSKVSRLPAADFVTHGNRPAHIALRVEEGGNPLHIPRQLPPLQGTCLGLGYGVKHCVWTPRIWDVWGTLELRGGRPDSATLCCPLSPSWQHDRGIYSSTTTHQTSSSAAPCWRRVAQPVCPSITSVDTHRLMENGVPPSVAVARLDETETEVCLLQSLRDRCALPQAVFPTRWGMGGLSLLTGPARDRRVR